MLISSSRGRPSPFVGGLRLGVLASIAGLACHACTSFAAAPNDDAGDASSDARADAVVDAGALSPSPSCRDLLAQNPALQGKNGIYAITPGDAGRLDVYCDMTLDKGGWTLAGRSSVQVPATLPPFGWSSATGSVQDTSAPYSLNVAAHQLSFSEVLVASVDGARAYKYAVSSTFLSVGMATVPTGTVTTVAGDCMPAGGPSMLKNTGAPAVKDVFFFRDLPDLGQHRGLAPGGFELSYQDCTRGASLDGVQGAILIR